MDFKITSNEKFDDSIVSSLDISVYRTVMFYMSVGWDSAVLTRHKMSVNDGDLEVQRLLEDQPYEDEVELTKLQAYITSPNQQGHYVACRLFADICKKYPLITGHLILSVYS